MRRYLVDIFEWRERPNIARSNIDQMLPKPPQTRLIFQEVSAIFGRYFGGDISYIPTFKYPQILDGRLRPVPSNIGRQTPTPVDCSRCAIWRDKIKPNVQVYSVGLRKWPNCVISLDLPTLQVQAERGGAPHFFERVSS
jgi:hypothetical protein